MVQNWKTTKTLSLRLSIGASVFGAKEGMEEERKKIGTREVDDGRLSHNKLIGDLSEHIKRNQANME